MENRDQKITEIRPVLELQSSFGAIETFQNKTLRPILKLQNNLLLYLCRHQFEKRKNIFFQLPKPERKMYITQQIQHDRQFRHLLFGVIIGHFTINELQFFRAEEAELKKRITSLLIQRIQSQLSLLTSAPA